MEITLGTNCLDNFEHYAIGKESLIIKYQGQTYKIPRIPFYNREIKQHL